ncbi:hypothetical protein AB0A74_20145 [Saccharothrix sp. NPDC042600]|uniref:hypothetical protein n=1 Tax=Saccharothrix TaxID=2071 RepID=UPI003404D1D5|nr:hypothetical protein GCM10017745_75400 [Saccharothrix mutabilis subsp. capreolus]
MTAISETELEHHLRHALLLHTDAQDCELAVESSNRDGGGLVLNGKGGLVAAERILGSDLGFRRPILVDASAYAGRRRRFASDPFDRDWMRHQRRLGLPAVLPDAGYVAEDDEDGLLSVLYRVHEEPQGTVALLALHHSWTDPKHGQPTLKQHALAAGVPLALVLEHPKDPMQVRRSVHGLVDLLDAAPSTMLLRSDASAVGSLCYGAIAAAVGTRTGLRHLYPLGRRGGRKASIAVFVRSTMSYITLAKLDRAYQMDPDNDLWRCGCDVCADADLSWVGSSPDPWQSAYLHSVEVLHQIRRDLFDNNLTPQQRRQAWIAQCDSAIFRHDELSELTDWEPPAYLGNWDSLRAREATA